MVRVGVGVTGTGAGITICVDVTRVIIAGVVV